MDELSPLQRDQVGSFLMAKADTETLPTNYQPKVTDGAKLTLSSLHSSLGPREGMIRAFSAMEDLGIISADQASQAAAAIMLISSGVQIAAGLQAMYDLLTSAKIAQGIAQIAKYGPLFPIVAAAAIGGAVLYDSMIENNIRTYNFQGDYSSSQGIRQMQQQLTGARS